VVDGSNLATEGRSSPSLAQLDQSVRAFLEERPSMTAIVVVDATFGHRIDKSEQARFKDAELAGEIVTPPAGAIGRGDAFILKIAARADGLVLSNDSFQEFHAEHPWLFEDGRLIGGKPIPGVGWIFTTRNPVRGPKSRAVRAKAAASPATAEAPHHRVSTEKAPATRARKGRGEPTASKRRSPSTQPAAKSAALSAATKQKVAPAKAAPKSPPRAETKRQAPAKPARTRTSDSSAQPAKAARQRPAKQDKQPAPARPAKPRTAKESGPVNTLRAFRALTSRHPVKSTVEGVVSSFTSHGAMITVTVGRGTKVDCYVPLAGLGRPAPTKARDVLKIGEKRAFRITSIDEDRRIAELSLA